MTNTQECGTLRQEVYDLAALTIRQLLESGAHFGHQTNRWNPKMKRYIFGSRNGIYIIDLQQTLTKFRDAYEFVRKTTARGEKLLFVGTKKQAQDIIASEAIRAQQSYVNQRWLGGMLTNFATIRRSLERLQEYEHMRDTGLWESLPKKEVLQLEKKMEKLDRLLGGIKHMDSLPGALFIIDCKKERIAIGEAKKLGIPTVAIVDTNCNPEEIDYVIPGNDDAIRTIRLITAKMAEAAIEGTHERQSMFAEPRAEGSGRVATASYNMTDADLDVVAQGAIGTAAATLVDPDTLISAADADEYTEGDDTDTSA